jgi:hypothetical protein
VQRPIPPNQPEHGRFAAGLFAATVVMTGGGGICLTIALVFAKDIWTPVAVLLCGLGGLVVSLWLLIDRPVRHAQNSNIYTAQKETLAEYVESFEPQHRRRRKPRLGNNPPPSADSIRQIREDSNVWSPSDRRAAEYRKNLEEADDLDL